MVSKDFNLKQFVIIVLITSIWIHISETLRAFFVAFPKMLSFFDGKIQIIGLDQLELSHALIWGIWDTILTVVLVFVYWLSRVTFGNNYKAIFISSTLTVFATIGIFWIGTINSGLGEWSTAFVIMPLAWVELIIGAWIASKLYNRIK